MIHGDGTCAPVQETTGMCAHHLQVVSLHVSDLVVWGILHAGQGAHREVGSEGFEANHRAVAENGEPVGQNLGDTEPALWRRRKYLRCLGVPRCVRTARWERDMCYPGRSRMIPYPTGAGTYAYKPEGEVVRNVMREVGVVRGTYEPGRNKNPGTVSVWDSGRRLKRRRLWGRGHVGKILTAQVKSVSRWFGGLMVAEAMTETPALRIPKILCQGN